MSRFESVPYGEHDPGPEFRKCSICDGPIPEDGGGVWMGCGPLDADPCKPPEIAVTSLLCNPCALGAHARAEELVSRLGGEEPPPQPVPWAETSREIAGRPRPELPLACFSCGGNLGYDAHTLLRLSHLEHALNPGTGRRPDSLLRLCLACGLRLVEVVASGALAGRSEAAPASPSLGVNPFVSVAVLAAPDR